MVYKVVMTRRGQELLDDCVLYILLEKLNEQAARAVIKDARETIQQLYSAAESLHLCNDPELEALGYRKILFRRHDYLFIYQVIDGVVFIEATYHQAQDYENLFKLEVL